MAAFLASLPDAARVRVPSHAALDLPDDEEGNEIEGAGQGNRIIKKPWPGMLWTLYFKDPERYQETYWSKYGDVYFAGDGARRDEDGYCTIAGRVDDVMNVSGHRVSRRKSRARSSHTRPSSKRRSSVVTMRTRDRRSSPT